MDTNEHTDGVTPARPAPAALPPQSWLGRNAPYLILFVCIFLYIQYQGAVLVSYWNGAKVLLGLGLVIFLHELGHFLVAKWCDVYVETFSIGFGPPLPGCCFKWGETTYMIALFPLGGYVKMLGEGAEPDEADTDPRSFKNKAVWQRMAIISAGVIMNVLLALGCFVFVYLSRGAERIPGIVDAVDNGSPAWKIGVHRGDVIRQIGDHVAHPPFDSVFFDKHLQPTVMLTKNGQKLKFVFSRPDTPPDQWTRTEIEPRLEEGDLKPVIGMAPPSQLRLLSPRAASARDLAVQYESAAAHASPPFAFGDRIVGCTDPDHPGQVTELPRDTRDPQGRRFDFFEFFRRMKRLAGQDVVVRVRRFHDPEDDQGRGAFTDMDIKVPPSFRYVFGLRMKLAAISAVRNPAQKADVKVGDVLDGVEVRDAHGKILRFVSKRTADSQGDAQVEIRDLDPERLPVELERWANSLPASAHKEVTLSLLSPNPPPENGKVEDRKEKIPKQVKVSWDDSWKFEREVPLGPSSPISIAGLGIAYRIETSIKAVEPDMPASRAALEKPAKIKFKKGDTVRILPRKGDVVTRGDSVFKLEDGSLEEGEPFTLKEGDDVEHGGNRVTLKEGAELWLEKSDTLNLRPDDVFKAYRFHFRVLRSWSPPWSWADAWATRTLIEPGKWEDLKENEWAHLPRYLQSADVKKLSFRVKRDSDLFEATLDAVEDKTWPMENRGWIFTVDTRIEKAESLLGAIGMGMDTTHGFIMQIYGNLVSLATGRLSYKNFGGPIMIGTVAFSIAGVNTYQFILFLGIISVNLAVINFLPIPVLDGGHMVFLTYEWIRGKPASEQVRALATYVGLAFIASLMIFVVYLDLMR